MKNLILILSTVCFLIGCKGPGGKSKEATRDTTEQHEQHATTLSLNNGQKWKADSSTKINVAGIRELITRFEAGQDNSNATRQVLGNDLQSAVDNMVAACKMQGPDHDALHRWLEPVLKNIQEMKKTGSPESVTATREQLDLFPAFFE